MRAFFSNEVDFRREFRIKIFFTASSKGIGLRQFFSSRKLIISSNFWIDHISIIFEHTHSYNIRTCVLIVCKLESSHCKGKESGHLSQWKRESSRGGASESEIICARLVSCWHAHGMSFHRHNAFSVFFLCLHTEKLYYIYIWHIWRERFIHKRLYCAQCATWFGIVSCGQQQSTWSCASGGRAFKYTRHFICCHLV